VYRVYILLGGALCALATVHAITIGEVLHRVLDVNELAPFCAGLLLLFLAIIDGATDTRRSVFASTAINIAGALFLVFVLGTQAHLFLPLEVPATPYIHYLAVAGFLLLAIIPFFTKSSSDAGMADFWITASSASFIAGLMLGGSRGVILTFCGMLLVVIAALLITTERRRDQWGAIAPNMAAVAFVAGAAIPVALISLGKEPQWTAYANSDPLLLAAGAAFLGGWLMLIVAATALKQQESGGNRFSDWLWRVSIVCSLAVAIILYLSYVDSEYRAGLLPLIAIVLFFASMPLLMLVAVFAVTEGARWGPGAALLELAAIAFVASGAAWVIMVSVITNPAVLGQGAHDPQLIAKAANAISAAGWGMVALSAFGLRTRSE
jgi:hypothetical protein